MICVGNQASCGHLESKSSIWLTRPNRCTLILNDTLLAINIHEESRIVHVDAVHRVIQCDDHNHAFHHYFDIFFSFLLFLLFSSSSAAFENRIKAIDWYLDSRLQFIVYKQAIIHTVENSPCAHSFRVFVGIYSIILKIVHEIFFFPSLQMKRKNYERIAASKTAAATALKLVVH